MLARAMGNLRHRADGRPLGLRKRAADASPCTIWWPRRPGATKRHGPIVAWIVDDTRFPKKGRHSVGVTRQYCGQVGKQENCRIAVSLSVATWSSSLPIGYRLYLPKEWAQDAERRQQAEVPEEIAFQSKPEIRNRRHQCRSVAWSVARYAICHCNNSTWLSFSTARQRHTPPPSGASGRHYYWLLQTDSTRRAIGLTFVPRMRAKQSRLSIISRCYR
jgi:hypothetical protein